MRTVTRKMTWVFWAVLCVAILFVAARPVAGGPQNVPGLKIDKKSIGGTVVNSNGGKAEAGVWVIAETKSLPAPFRKIVVTDDQGRFLVPDLPAADYQLWVRGYGLKDSERVKADCGDMVKLQVANAATPQEAAKIYPASYWTSLIQPPPMRSFQPGSESRRMACDSEERVQPLPCARHAPNAHLYHCERLGRYVPARPIMHQNLMACVWWSRRCSRLGRRVMAGGFSAPPRPTGIERNVVISQWIGLRIYPSFTI